MSRRGGEGVGLWRRGPLTDLGAVVVAVGAAVGAVSAQPVPVGAGVAALAAALWARRPLLLALGVGVLTAGLAHQAWEGLSPLEPRPFEGVVVLTSDPTASFGGWRADARTDVGRVELSARGGAGGRLSSRQAGERVEVHGRLQPLTDPQRSASRHLRARLVVERVVPLDGGTLPMRLVNHVRSLVVDGARSLPDHQRALFTGFVLGDDRGSSIVVEDDFEASGLSHLLVVSGQNVVFVVAVATPLIGRLRRRARFAATLGLLVVFAAVTRFEPSVLRATAMAAVAATAVLVGRPVSGIRVLALAVTALLVVDPLLAESLGFRLSTAASAGIILLTGPLARVLPGPRWLALPLSVTLAAQAAVAPLLVPVFGPMPVAALPANLLAEPVAGLVMMWGCTGGLLAGVVPPWFAAVLHLPTRLGLWWVAEVARIGAEVPLGHVGLGVIAAVTGGLVVAAWFQRTGRKRAGACWATLAVALLVAAPHVGGGASPSGRAEVGGAELWRAGGEGGATVLVVPGDAHAPSLLAGLRAHDVDHLDLVVLTSAGPTAAATLQVVRQRIGVDVVWAPEGSPARGADHTESTDADGPEVVVPRPSTVRAGGLAITTRRSGEGLAVEVEVVAPGAVGEEVGMATCARADPWARAGGSTAPVRVDSCTSISGPPVSTSPTAPS